MRSESVSYEGVKVYIEWQFSKLGVGGENSPSDVREFMFISFAESRCHSLVVTEAWPFGVQDLYLIWKLNSVMLLDLLEVILIIEEVICGY